MAVFGTKNGCSPERCDNSCHLIISGITNRNRLEILSKKDFSKNSLEDEKATFKNLKNKDALNGDSMAVASVAKSSYI